MASANFDKQADLYAHARTGRPPPEVPPRGRLRIYTVSQRHPRSKDAK